MKSVKASKQNKAMDRHRNSEVYKSKFEILSNECKYSVLSK